MLNAPQAEGRTYLVDHKATTLAQSSQTDDHWGNHDLLVKA